MINDKNLSPIAICILKALENGDKYGYEIINEVEKLVATKISIKQPNLYMYLKKLENQQLITSYWKDSEIGGKRHYYLLTDLGKDELIKNQNMLELIISHKININQENKVSNLDDSTFLQVGLDNQSSTLPNDSDKLEEINGNNESLKENISIQEDTKKDTTSSTTFLKPNERIYNVNNIKVEPSKSYDDIPKYSLDNKVVVKANEFEAQNNVVNNANAEIKNNEVETKAPTFEEKISEVDYKDKLKEIYNPENNEKLDLTSNFNEVDNEEKLNEQTIKNITTVADFSSFGIEVKKHSKISSLNSYDEDYILKNKVNMFSSFTILGLSILEFIVTYFWLNGYKIINDSNSSAFIVFGLFPLIYSISRLSIFIINPYKKEKIDNDFKQELFNTSIFSLVFIIMIFALNFLFGMTNLNQSNFILYWLLPTLLCINLIIEKVIKFAFTKINNFKV
jgi:PadR family transcriptional regulator, regulatory protein PadR